MGKRKKHILIAMTVFVLLISACSAAGILARRNHQATYITIAGTEYRRDIRELTLSGADEAALHQLAELPNLAQLDLRGTNITRAQYDVLCRTLPGCDIRWSVPFQGQKIDSAVTFLQIARFSSSDIPLLTLFPALAQIDASGCPDYAALTQLLSERPDLTVTFTVRIGGTDYTRDITELTVSNPDPKELEANLPYLPQVQTVTLTGLQPDNAPLVALKDAFPAITFLWNFSLCGIEVNTLAEFVDLSGVQLESTDELEAALPCFYNLTQVDMCGCGIPNEEMDALNFRNRDTKFVWTIRMGGHDVRTDIRYIMPLRQGIYPSYREYNLFKYFKDIEVIDFGHRHIGNVSFVREMPKLRCLLLCESMITDLRDIGACTSLEYLEFFGTPATDFWPLTNLKNLRDLNLSRTPYDFNTGEPRAYGGDMTPLMQMTWLDRLWLVDCGMSSAQRDRLRTSLPDTVMVFRSSGCTTSGFRYTPRYFWQRDVLEMKYYHN